MITVHCAETGEKYDSIDDSIDDILESIKRYRIYNNKLRQED